MMVEDGEFAVPNRAPKTLAILLTSIVMSVLFVSSAHASSTRIAASSYHTVGLKPDGTVVAAGRNNYGQCDVSSWTSIVAVAAGDSHTVGLKPDGTVVAAGGNSRSQCDVSSWTSIVAVAAGASHTVGLRSDGTVLTTYGDAVWSWTDVVAVAAGRYCTVGLKSDGTVVTTGGQEVPSWTNIVAVAVGDSHIVGLKSNGTVVTTGGQAVSSWTGIVAIAAGGANTVGLKSDGTVVADGENANGQTNVSSWTDIAAVAAGSYHTLGLKSDGTVVAAGANAYGQRDAGFWTDITAVAASSYHTVGIRSDGTAAAAGQNTSGQCDVSAWTDIVAVAASSSHTVGVKSDGTVVAVGSNYYGQCDVASWTDIVAVAVPADGSHTVGLKSDGTVVAAGKNGFGQTNVSSWKNIVSVAADRDLTVGVTSGGTVVSAGVTTGDDGPRTLDWYRGLVFFAPHGAYYWGLDSGGRVSVSSYGWYFPEPDGVGDFTDITTICARQSGAVGLKSDGTVVACGQDSSGETDVSSWNDIVAIAAGDSHTVGLRADGTLVVVGGGAGACDISTWRLSTLMPLADAHIGDINASYAYTGKAIRPIPAVNLGTQTPVAGRDYTVIYSNNTLPGTATITVMGTSAFPGSRTTSFTITPQDFSTALVGSISVSYSYTGSEIRPAPAVKLGSQTLVAGKDYSVAYSHNVLPGTAAMTISGQDGFAGTVVKTFAITRKSISGSSVGGIRTTYIYTGNQIRPTPTVALGGIALRAGTDYTVSYANNTALGTATIAITGRGVYSGTVKRAFKVIQSVTPLSKTLYVGKTTTITYKGGSGTVTWRSSNTGVATVNSKGVVTAKKAGTAYITATRNAKKSTSTITVKRYSYTASLSRSVSSEAGYINVAVKDHLGNAAKYREVKFYKSGVLLGTIKTDAYGKARIKVAKDYSNQTYKAVVAADTYHNEMSVSTMLSFKVAVYDKTAVSAWQDEVQLTAGKYRMYVSGEGSLTAWCGNAAVTGASGSSADFDITEGAPQEVSAESSSHGTDVRVIIYRLL